MQRNYTNILLDNSDDYFWVLDVNYNLVYANKAYLEHIKEVIGKDKELNTTVFVEGFGDGYIEKWKGYYSKAFQGISYQTDMELNNPGSNFSEYCQITFVPLKNEDDEIYAVSCHSKDFTAFLNNKLENEQRYKALIQEGFGQKALLDENGNYLYKSTQTNTFSNDSLEDFIGKSFFESLHPEDLEKVLTSFQKINTESRVVLEPFRFQNNENKWRWMETVLTNMLENPSVNAIVANSREITEEMKLRQLNSQANRLAKIGSWEVDLINNQVFWSDEVHNLHETDSKTFTPNTETAINFYREDFRKLVASSIEKCALHGEQFDFEAVLVTSKMKEIWVRAIGNGEFIQGKCTRIYGSFQDIQDRKSSENMLKSISENLPGVIYQYTINPDGSDTMSHILGDVEQLWGYTKQEILKDINLLWNQIKLGGEIEKVQKSILESIQSKSRWNCRFKTVLPTGELKTHLGNGTLTFLFDGSIVFNVIVLDVTNEAKNEDLLAHASKISKIGSWEMSLIDQENDSLYWSPLIKEILELEETYNPALSGGLEFFVGEYKEQFQQAANNLNNFGAQYDIEVLINTAKGKEKWIRIIGKSEYVNNKLTRVFGSFQDITDRKKVELDLVQAKQKAEENEARFMGYTEQSSISIYTSNIKGDCLYANQTWLAMAGMELNEALGDGWVNAIHKDDLAYVKENWYKSIKSNGNWRYQYRFVDKKGKIIWVEGTAKELLNEKNELIGYLGTNINITDRKKADEELLLANQRFEKVTEATNDAIWDWDLENHTYYRSKAIEKFFGKNVAKSVDENDFWKDSFHPDDLPKVKLNINEALSNPLCNRWESEYRILNEEGKLLYVIDRGVIIRNNEGIATRMVGAMTDITEQKQLNLQLSDLNQELQKYTKELERSNEELEQFAFVTSHDLQEPLRMITSFMDLLKRKYGDNLDEKALQYIYFATDGANRMKQIILDLLEFSRANRPTEGKEMIDINDLLSEFKQLRRKILLEKKVTILSEKLPSLFTYKAAITQIIHCLIDNAIKYTTVDFAPIIEVSAEESSNEWKIAIKDNGIGIDEQFFNKIFVIFQRLHNKEEYSGTGIGLSIAKRHVEFLGGSIWLTSTVGEGSIFYFTIPK